MVGIHCNSITWWRYSADCFRHEDRSLQNQLGTSKKHQLDHQFSSLLCGSSLKVWSWAGLDAGILSIESSQRSQPRLKSCGRRSKFKSGQRSNPPLLPLSPWHIKAMVGSGAVRTLHPTPLKQRFLSALPGHSSTNTITDSGCQRIWVRPKSLPNYPKLTLKIS